MDQSHISGFPTLPQCATEMSEEGGKEQEERRNKNGKYVFLFLVHTSPVCERDADSSQYTKMGEHSGRMQTPCVEAASETVLYSGWYISRNGNNDEMYAGNENVCGQ